MPPKQPPPKRQQSPPKPEPPAAKESNTIQPSKEGYEPLVDDDENAPTDREEVVVTIEEDTPPVSMEMVPSSPKKDELPPVRINNTGQFKLEWTVPLVADGVTLEPGELNLYIFPGGYSGANLNALRNAILDLARTRIDMFEVPDPVGAQVIHALVVCNSPASLELAFDVIAIAPQLLLQTHVGQPFSGENCLHIVCVNRRPDIGIKMVDTVMANFDNEQAKQFLTSDATGVFFESQPMSWYGDTPLAFAAPST